MTVKWALVKTSPFQGLSEDEKHDILSRMLCVHYDPGERLELGREPGGWWVVEKGLMKVYSIAPDGSALTYAILSAGDSFGETTILTGH
jgi:CRP-like cAMP-binding protein